MLLRHAPYQKKFRKSNQGDQSRCTPKPWITTELKTLITDKHRKYSLYKENPTPENRQNYYSVTNLVKRKLKCAQEAFNKREYGELRTSKQKWNFINKARGAQKEIPQINALTNSFGDVITDKNKICNLLNVKFSNLGEYSGNYCQYVPATTNSRTHFAFSYVTEQQCIKVITSLNPKKPMGPSAIPG